MTARTVYVVDALRSPIAKWRGGLAGVRSDDLAAHVLSALIARNESLAARLDQVIFGATNQAGEDNRNVARMAVLLANLPYTVPALTVNRLCGSGLEAVNDAARMILAGEAEVVIAGGVESMTRSPYTMPKAAEGFDRTPPTVYDTSLGWRYPNPKMAARFPLESMGETAENVAEKHGISREDQDVFAAHSQEKAAKAWAAGHFASEIAPLSLPQKKGEPIVFARDESVREGVTAEALAKLPAVFRKGGSVTAGNSSPINDGAASVLLASEEAVRAAGVTPLARWMGSATAGVEPSLMGEGPIPATQKLLVRLGRTVRDLDLVELNEAFAAQSLACIRGLELDPDIVNIRGGAIALGHPIGASGARIVGTLVHAMHAEGKKTGLASLCIGVGQGIATLFERALRMKHAPGLSLLLAAALHGGLVLAVGSRAPKSAIPPQLEPAPLEIDLQTLTEPVVPRAEAPEPARSPSPTDSPRGPSGPTFRGGAQVREPAPVAAVPAASGGGEAIVTAAPASPTDGGVAVPLPAASTIRFGLPMGSFLEDPRQAGLPGPRAAPDPALTAGRVLRDLGEAHDRALGVGFGGLVASAGRTALSSAGAPVTGQGRYEVRTDATGRVVSVRALGGDAAWQALAQTLASALAGRALRVPPGAQGVVVVVALSAAMKPVAGGSGGLSGPGASFDIANLAAGPSRVVSSRIESERTL